MEGFSGEEEQRHSNSITYQMYISLCQSRFFDRENVEAKPPEQQQWPQQKQHIIVLRTPFEIKCMSQDSMLQAVKEERRGRMRRRDEGDEQSGAGHICAEEHSIANQLWGSEHRQEASRLAPSNLEEQADLPGQHGSNIDSINRNTSSTTRGDVGVGGGLVCEEDGGINMIWKPCKSKDIISFSRKTSLSGKTEAE